MNDTERFLGGVCFITGRASGSISYGDMVQAALKGGIRCVQLRAKDMSRRELYEEALHLRDITSAFRAAFIVNDHADIAAAADADGVHLGQDDLPIKEARKIVGRRIIGISTHSIEEAEAAGNNGADYIGFGPVFETKTKDAGHPKGVEMLRRVKESVRIPVVAIGGISLENIESVAAAGADSVAVSSFLLAGDVEKNSSAVIRLIRRSG